MSKLDELEKIDRDFLMPKSKNTQASAGRDKSEPLRGFSTTLP